MTRHTKLSITFYEKYFLTVEETAVYFHIGYKKLRSDWIIRVRFKMNIK